MTNNNNNNIGHFVAARRLFTPIGHYLFLCTFQYSVDTIHYPHPLQGTTFKTKFNYELGDNYTLHLY